MATFEVTLHDGSRIQVLSVGTGPAILLPVRSAPFDEAIADTMRQWGADPDLGLELIAGLAPSFRVIAADYEGHRMAHPAPSTLTPETISADLLAIADAADVDSFAYYGYSWLALSGLQLALRSDRLWGLVMGGFPPVDGPYAAMLAVTRAAHRMSEESVGASSNTEVEPGDWSAVQVDTTTDQTRQFVSLYEALAGFDNSVLPPVTIPRLCFAGSADRIEYGAGWGETVVEIAAPLQLRATELEADGWEVRLLDGLDHLSAMHSDVALPVLADWFGRNAPDPLRS